MQQLIDNMVIAESSFQKSISILPKARFKLGKIVYVKFDRGSEGHGMGGLVICDGDGK